MLLVLLYFNAAKQKKDTHRNYWLGSQRLASTLNKKDMIDHKLFTQSKEIMSYVYRIRNKLGLSRVYSYLPHYV